MITAKFVRKLIADKAHTQVSAALAIGISPRSMRRYVSEKNFQEPPMVVLVALKGMPMHQAPARTKKGP